MLSHQNRKKYHVIDLTMNSQRITITIYVQPVAQVYKSNNTTYLEDKQ